MYWHFKTKLLHFFLKINCNNKNKKIAIENEIMTLVICKWKFQLLSSFKLFTKKYERLRVFMAADTKSYKTFVDISKLWINPLVIFNCGKQL